MADFGPVAAAVRQLGGRVTVAQVIEATGLPVDEVECELGSLLRDAGGLFAVGEELSAGGGHLRDACAADVCYVFPPGDGIYAALAASSQTWAGHQTPLKGWAPWILPAVL